ncbi:MAG: cell division protein SepF [Firmicutes bacterium]|nr:cell division protein SepF [Bacillota bacterium]
MAKKLMDKVMGFIGFDDEIMDEEELEGESSWQEKEDSRSNAGKRGQVVKLHSERQVKVVVAEPKVFEEVQGIADNLKNRCPVIINLEQADPELAQRVVDFISGAAYALNGTMQKVGNGIFLFVPSSMDISNELRDQLREKGMFAWIKQ